MNRGRFSQYAGTYIECLWKEGRYSTAHVYKNASSLSSKFCGTLNISFRQVTRECLRYYGQHLYESGLKFNTISTYIRMLHSVYNREVETESAPCVPRSFHDVYISVDTRQKKALPVTELHKLLHGDPKSERLCRTQTIAALVFQLCGMLFIDLMHSEKSALNRNVLQYNRIGTKTPMSLEILESAREMMNQSRSNKPAFLDCPDYLFDILHSDRKRKDEEAYKEYQSVLYRSNNCLKDLVGVLRPNPLIASYTFRHSWVTTAKYRGVPIEIISELLRYKSTKITQTYPRGFELRERIEVNRKNLSYARDCSAGRQYIGRTLIISI